MVVPLGQRATDDLANVLVHAAETWQVFSFSERQAFVKRMNDKHELIMTDANLPLANRTNLLPYLHFLEESLHKQLGQEVQIKQSVSADGEEWFWVDIPVSGNEIRFGFPRSRIGVKPPIALFLLTFVGLHLTILTAVALTRRLTRPIDLLHQTAQAIGKGEWPEPIEIDGPEELSILAREFNRMNKKVRELLANRTTLLAGISHDLRTPLSQIQIALAMLPEEGGDPRLMASILEDLDQINNLIGETLSISMELEEEKEVLTNIGEEIRQIIKSIQTNDVEISVSHETPCCQLLHPRALRRILTNLLVNAVRYGDNKPISVSYQCNANEIIIQIDDQGPGIPPEQVEAVFQPFFRLESSRGSGTGGSGLGLAIVRQLADANGWEVELLPRPGGGTRAVLRV